MLVASSKARALRTRVFRRVSLLATFLALGAAVGAASLAACAVDTVDPSATATRPASGNGEASPDGRGSGQIPSTPPPPPPSDARAPGHEVPDATGVPPADPDCVLQGRWLAAQRVVAAASGQEQAAHNWFYLEIRHEAQNLTVTKGLHCGFEVVKITNQSASVDSSGAWPALLQRTSSTGRKGTYVKEGAGCKLTLDKEYIVRGATVPYYLDPSRPLPAKDQPALDGKPGWEDWDNDTNPGISLNVSAPAAKGTLYVAQRDWTLYSGTTPAKASKFQVAITYGNEQVALGRAPGSSILIETPSKPSSDPKQHYAWFHQLADGQAVGTDTEICAKVRALKDQLVPEANK